MMNSPLLFGIHAVEAAVLHPLRTIYKVMIDQDRQDKRIKTLIALLQEHHIAIEFVDKSILKKHEPDQRHQGVLAFVSSATTYEESDLDHLCETYGSQLLLLILDGVTDPHNLGACLRTAEATGVHAVIIPKDNSASLSPVVSKIACGAAEYVPVIAVTNVVRCMERLKKAGVWLYGAAGEASESLYELECNSGPIAILLGREGEGLRRLVKEKCDFLFSIPMRGHVSSLNVSVATGVALYEVVRQRLH